MGWLGLAAVVAFAVVAFVAVEAWKRGERGRWLWLAAALVLGGTALVYAPLGDGACHVDWDGRGNPIECE